MAQEELDLVRWRRNRMGRGNGRLASWRALLIGAWLMFLIGCAPAEPPRFVLNMEGRNPLNFTPSGFTKERLQERIDERQKEYDELQKEDPQSSRLASLDEQLSGYRALQTRDANAQGLRDIEVALYALFGDPDDPEIPPGFGVADMPENGFDLAKLQRAAGRVGSDEDGTQHGLFRQHCVHCHGITGDGAGPTAIFLNPYPRDFRPGVFKFTSTDSTAKATKADLKRTLEQGIAGTAMPSFVLLPESDIETLVEYVRYLALRGEVERELFGILENDGAISLAKDDLISIVQGYAAQWDEAPSMVVIPETPAELPDHSALEASIAQGKELYKSARAQCVQCHGPTGLGDGTEKRFDVWNDEKKPENIAFFTLPKQPLVPRNLRSGVYRGGRRPVDLFRRIQAGIKGAQMPSMGKTDQNPSGLSPEEIWQIVHYVQSLPYEAISETGAPQQTVERARN